jgi:predicted small lipoprotein YifL
MKILKNPKCHPAVLALTVTMILATTVIMGGCGKKGPPEPPTGSRPPRIKDLGYGLSQNTVKLSWTIPQLDEKAQLPITGFLIYRAQQPLSQTECPNCPIMFKSIGDVPARGAGPGQPPITFTETIESGYRYIYKVHGYSDDGIRSRSSNFIEFAF